MNQNTVKLLAVAVLTAVVVSLSMTALGRYEFRVHQEFAHDALVTNSVFRAFRLRETRDLLVTGQLDEASAIIERLIQIEIDHLSLMSDPSSFPESTNRWATNALARINANKETGSVNQEE